MDRIVKQTYINTDIEKTLKEIHNNVQDCPDVIIREIQKDGTTTCCLLYINRLIDMDLAARDFIKPLLHMTDNGSDLTDAAASLPVGNLHFSHTIAEILEDILTGHMVFLMAGYDFSVSTNLKKSEHRSVHEPDVEKNVKGAHDGFIESIDTNISLLRKRINNTNLKFRILRLGTSSNQKVAISYIQGIANETLISQVEAKVSSINFDGLNGNGYIEQLITDHPNSLFPQIQTTERPDKVVPALLEGRILVMLDGTPVMLLLPVSFFSFFQSPDDYNLNWLIGSFLRLMRLLAVFFTLFLPGIYIAILSFHYYMIPLDLLIPVAESRIRVPFPPLLEALIMELIIEFLREASIRLPTYVGNSIGIVGGLVLGQAAVDAGIVSTLMVIVVGVTAISSFTVPSINMSYALRLTRFFIMIAASVFGMIGVTISVVLLLAHLMALESLGQPYFQPIIPLKTDSLKDTLMRLPMQFQKIRPNETQSRDKERGK